MKRGDPDILCDEKAAHLVIDQVRSKLLGKSIGLDAAAKEIGVTKQAFERHLAGQYVRSDSLAKYRLWIAGTKRSAVQATSNETPALKLSHQDVLSSLKIDSSPTRPFLVVDTFSGCGGLSLGFELLDEGRVFDVVLALDVEEAMVKSYNWNRTQATSSARICRLADVADFVNQTEVIAFYLDHLAKVRNHAGLRVHLESGPLMRFEAFVGAVLNCDMEFLRSIRSAYASHGSARDSRHSQMSRAIKHRLGVFFLLYLSLSRRQTCGVWLR